MHDRIRRPRPYDDGGRMNARQVRDAALTFFLAGNDTSLIALAWMWSKLGT
jgi:cytochrome P450